MKVHILIGTRSLVAWIGLLAPLAAQCAQWTPGEGLPGIAGPVGPGPAVVNAFASWDPDGPGPLPAKVVVGGNFTRIGNAVASHLAIYDPVTRDFSPLGSGTNAPVLALAAMANGDLAVGGEFTEAGGGAIGHLARWDGNNWSAIGSGLSGPVFALANMPNGDLVAGGSFSHAGGVTVNRIARWNGTAWSPMVVNGPFVGFSGNVHCLCVLANGDLVAGGSFSQVGGVTMLMVARFNGTSWSSMGLGLTNLVLGLTSTSNGHVYAAGLFNAGFRRWDGTSWTELGLGTDGIGNTVVTLSNGDVVAGGRFNLAGTSSTSKCIARWSGNSPLPWGTWLPVGAGVDGPTAMVRAVLELPNGGLLVGGDFATAGNVPALSIGEWDGSSWLPVATGPTDEVFSQLVMPNGDRVVAGRFAGIGGIKAAGIARSSSTGWSALGSGTNGEVRALGRLTNGDIIAGGSFTQAGGQSAFNIAQWNGTAWSPLGNGLNHGASAIAILPNDDIIVGGSFLYAGGVQVGGVARWNGSSWSALGTGLPGHVTALTAMPNGDIVAATSYVARWNGVAWSMIGSDFLSSVYCFAVMPNGDLVAGGRFFGVGFNNIARWNGSMWQALGSGLNEVVHSLVVLPDGDLLAGGDFTMAGGAPANHVARWNGASWSALQGADDMVKSMVFLREGDIGVGGEFRTINGRSAPFLGRIVSSCPATAITNAAGCASSGGSNVLTATALPWINATFRTNAAGLPGHAWVVVATGFTTLTPATPLTSLFPLGAPGCDLHVMGDILDVVETTNGTVSWQIFVPPFPPIVGMHFYQQMVPIEIDPQGAWVSVTATNVLQLTVGMF